MKQIFFAAAIFGLVFSINTADAQPIRNHKGKTEMQHKRIRHGARTGNLTKPELARLNMQQAKVRHYEQMARMDGVITPRERQAIIRAEKHLDRNIYAQKHDRQRRHRGSHRSIR